MALIAISWRSPFRIKVTQAKLWQDEIEVIMEIFPGVRLGKGFMGLVMPGPFRGTRNHCTKNMPQAMVSSLSAHKFLDPVLFAKVALSHRFDLDAVLGDLVGIGTDLIAEFFSPSREVEGPYIH